MRTDGTRAGFRPGRVVQRREVLHGRLWLTHPVTVVADRDGVLAVLQLHREGDPYSVWLFFDGTLFTHWYVNLEAPVVRHPDGTGSGSFDTDDHGLDIVVPADGSPWSWKDVDDPAAMAAEGRITAAQAEQVHADGRAVAALIDADDRWWAAWDGWTPASDG